MAEEIRMTVAMPMEMPRIVKAGAQLVFPQRVERQVNGFFCIMNAHGGLSSQFDQFTVHS